MLKGNRSKMTEDEIVALEKVDAKVIQEAVIEFLLMRRRVGNVR